MATATLVRPGVPYPQPHPYGPSQSTMPDMIARIEPRRTSDPTDAPQHRQSLPPISEVISSAGSPVGGISQPPAPAISVPSFPSPYPAQQRLYRDTHSGLEQGPAAHHLHPSTYHPRPEPLPSFSEASRGHPYAGRPGPSPLNAYPPSHPSPTSAHDRARLESDKAAEQNAMNGAYHHPPPPIAPYPAMNQLHPTPPYPIGPSHPGSTLHPQFDAHRGPPPRPEGHDASQARTRYDMTLTRHIEAWTYQECLSRVGNPLDN
jgi:hypothetical protein